MKESSDVGIIFERKVLVSHSRLAAMIFFMHAKAQKRNGEHLVMVHEINVTCPIDRKIAWPARLV